MIRIFLLLFLSTSLSAEPLPIDDLWKSAEFQKSITGSYGIDSQIEPRITEDEAFYLEESAKAMAAKDRDKAIKTLSEASILEKSAAMRFSLAGFLFEADRIEESIEQYRETLTLFPNFRDARRNLAVSLIRIDEVEEAEKHLVRAIELGARDGLTMGLLGYCHSRDEDFQPALDAYRQAMLTEPDNVQWKTGAAQALKALGESEMAASLFQTLLKENPENTYPWLAQADTWVSLKKPEKAISNLEFAHRSGFLTADSTLTLAHLLVQNDLPDLALERYESAVKRENPLTFTKAAEAVELLVHREAWSQAKQLTETILSLAGYVPPSLEAEANGKDPLSGFTRSRALIEMKLGDPEKAVEILRDWTITHPLDGEALILLARYYEQSGAREEAEMLLEQAQALPKHAAAAHRAQGQLLVSKREFAAGLEHLQTSQELEPSDSLAEYIEAVEELVE